MYRLEIQKINEKHNFLICFSSFQVFFPNAKEGDFQFVTMPNLLIRIHPNGETLYILR